MPRLLFFAITLVIMNSHAWAQKPAPKFKDYPVKEIYQGKNAPIALTRDDRMFRTRLSNAAQAKPNFAGHYIVTAWGCGAECLMGAAIDAKTGKVHWWDFSVCCWNDNVQKPIDFRLDSALIVFSGLRNEEGSKGPHYYKIENGRFIQLRRRS
jgi:hypothetical protein